MLQLKNVVKTYVTGDMKQDALKGVSITFRENEFVSILGQSGSGKTTMLNIIGGLDRYTDGDLVINGISTKKYKDADWDYYRNHSIGFVFQSYNLIPHQSVLANVEMALTLAGISKKERKQRAIAVLEKVGLGDHIHKRPNQMSGGQMQRVAIARALVNNPEILLADEPTGALDSETSVQIMELLKEIAKDKLVIMVTHNPELAEKYSTRIVKLLDGKIISDTDPYEEEQKEKEKGKTRKISMSFFTALSLSFHNLRTKKGRTLLTSFAGSIGIIGIALILALSTGMNDYISSVQKDTMASYPITISDETVDMSSAMGMQGEMVGMMQEETGEEKKKRTGVYADYRELEAQKTITSSVVENNLTEFKKYLDDPESDIHQYLGENGIVYNYDVDFSVYSNAPDGSLVDSDMETEELSSAMQSENFGAFSELPIATVFDSMTPSGAANFSELMSAPDGTGVNSAVTDQYDVLYGAWPQKYDEVVLVLNRENGIAAGKLYQLGLLTKEQYDTAVEAIENKEEAEEICFSYEDICKHEFYLVPACDHYKQKENGTFEKLEDLILQKEELLKNAVTLKISGIVRLKEDEDTIGITTAVAYTRDLTDYLITYTNDSAVVLAQQKDPAINVMNGVKFEARSEEEKAQEAKEYLSNLGVSEKAAFYQLMMYYSAGNAAKEDSAEQSPFGMLGLGLMSDETTMATGLDRWLENEPDQEALTKVYDEYISGATYEENMKAFGKVSYDAPSSISLYTDSFENKDAIADCITRYNETATEDTRITYTDYVAMLTSSITTIINGISYVLIAFVTISLVVSCIMIGIITHISVMERTKEIGILRALGASKRNVSQVFNAETFIIGCCSGILGILVSLAALIPINMIITELSGLTDLKAQLPLTSSLILIVISILITMLGGLLPAKKAAKKDPVIALRTE